MTPKIYAFCYKMEGFEFTAGAAVAEDGAGLAEHISSSEEWCRRDMQHAAKREIYAAHYPDGYDLIWLGFEPDFVLNPEFAAALRLNQTTP